MPKETKKTKKIMRAFLIFLALCATTALIGSWATYPSIGGWYRTLAKPFFSPPNWLFGPVWTLLYFLMAVSATLLWQHWPGKPAKVALGLFQGQLILNVLWSVLFFGLRAPGLALVEILFLWGTILAWILASWKVSRIAASLQIPYLLWVSFATVLNFFLWRLNV